MSLFQSNPFGSSYSYHGLCGCYVIYGSARKYLPQVSVSAHTTILAQTSRTTLTQVFTNPLEDHTLEQIRYIFPLYDGVSVVAFKCTIGNRVIKGVVKEREKAKQVYQEATARGETAGLLEQSLESADVFTTSIGNVPPREEVKVEITYLGELKHDAEVDGVRFTIPTAIVPRYGQADSLSGGSTLLRDGGFSVTIDVEMPEGSAVRSIQSPSHPLTVNVGTTSVAPKADLSLRKASATMTQQKQVSLDKEFIVQIVATNMGEPAALLETHPTIANERAIMATLVPKFKLPAERPEIVFVCDRSGSMGSNIPDLISALNIFLKSLPVGVKFNICSFGNSFDFLWSRSKSYSQESLDEAVRHVNRFSANYGGTQMYEPLRKTFENRYKDMNLEVFLLTDGAIRDQENLFQLINTNVRNSKGAIRVFSLGIGAGVSTSLIEGVARAGKGFSQSVAYQEKMEKKMIRMLKASLFPHITDYTLEVKYGKSKGEKAAGVEDDDGFEIVEKVMDSLKLSVDIETKPEAPKSTISLFNRTDDDDDTNMDEAPAVESKYDHLPAIPVPRYIQTPMEIPPLFPYNRTTVYVLLSDSTPSRVPTSIVLRGTSAHGPLELEVPITVLDDKASTVHQLAARKEVKELEEGRGWVSMAKDKNGSLLAKKYDGRYDEIREREAVRLGVKYQVGGKWCSFVAVEDDEKELDDFSVHSAEPGKGTRKRFRATASRVVHGVMATPQPVFGQAYNVLSQRRMVAKGGMFGSMTPQPPLPISGGAPPPVMRSAGVFGNNNAVSLFGAPPAPARAPPPGAGGASFGMAASPFAASSSSASGFGTFGSGAPPSGADVLVDLDFDSNVQSDSSADLFSADAIQCAFSPTSGASDDDSRLASTGGRGALQTLTRLQKFSGSWAWSGELERTLGVSKEAANGLKVPESVMNHADRESIVATACAIVYMKTHLAADEEAWEMMVEKAESWLEGEIGGDWDELKKIVAVLL